LSAELAEEVVSKSERGYGYAAFIKNITGGAGGAPTRGVNLMIVVAEPGVSDNEVQRYVSGIDLSDADTSSPRRGPSSGTGCLGQLCLLARIIHACPCFTTSL